MGVKVKTVAVCCMLFRLSIASLVTASDLRLVEATEKGDKETMRYLLKQHVDVNGSGADGATALAWESTEMIWKWSTF